MAQPLPEHFMAPSLMKYIITISVANFIKLMLEKWERFHYDQPGSKAGSRVLWTFLMLIMKANQKLATVGEFSQVVL